MIEGIQATSPLPTSSCPSVHPATVPRISGLCACVAPGATGIVYNGGKSTSPSDASSAALAGILFPNHDTVIAWEDVERKGNWQRQMVENLSL